MKKKLLSVLLCLALVFGTVIPAFASYLGGTVPVNQIDSMTDALQKSSSEHPITATQYGDGIVNGAYNNGAGTEKIGVKPAGTVLAHTRYSNALKVGDTYYDMEVKVTLLINSTAEVNYGLTYNDNEGGTVPYIRSFLHAMAEADTGKEYAEILVRFYVHGENTVAAIPSLAYGNTCWVNNSERFNIQDHGYELYAQNPSYFYYNSTTSSWMSNHGGASTIAETLWSYSEGATEYKIMQVCGANRTSGSEILFGYFKNTVDPVTSDVTVTKKIDGEGTGTFTFTLTPCNASGSAVSGYAYSVTNATASKECTGTSTEVGPFGTCTYDLAGTYYNLISEKSSDGWDCDTAKYIQKVVVSQNKKTLKLSATVSYTDLAGNAVAADALTFTNKLSEYSVTYKFEGPGPDETAPTDNNVYNWHDKVTTDTTFKEGDTVDGVKDGVPGTWTFKGWTPDENLTENGVEGDVEFIGTWEFSEKTYSVTYKFRGDVPEGVTAPTDDGAYKWHDDVTRDKTYQKDDEKVVDHGKWVFKGWIANDKLTPNGVEGDVEFVGEWEYIPDTYTVTYQFDGDAPADVTAPEDTNKYSFHDEVTVDSTFKKDDVIVGMKDGVKGKWIFTGWETDENINDDGLIEDDAVITGRWAFDHDKYNVVYEFEGDVPAGVVAPVDEKEYKWHDDVKVDKTYKVDDEIKGEKDGVPGTWKFSGWTADENITEDGIENNAKFTGKWGFDGDVYTVKYEFAGEVPADVKAPVDEAEYKWHDGVETDDTYKPGDSVDAVKDGVPGKWVFEGWTPDENLTENGVEGDVVFTGEWKFVPDTYSVTYEFEGDAPEGVKPPVDDKAYNWHDAFTPDDTLKEGEQVKGDKDGVPGTWTFSGFTTRDKLSENGIENDMKYTGTWTFTPAEYKVAYRFDGDTPADVTAPVDEKTYKWHDGVTVDETYKEGDTITGKKDGKEFTWTFKGWKATDTLTENGIEGDVVFTGVWEYSEKIIDTPVDPQKPMGDNGILIIMAVVFAAAAAAFIVTTVLKKKKAE